VPARATVIDFVAEQFPVSSVIVSWQPAGNELAAGRVTVRAAVSPV
jgi:hypothetical protein